MNRHRWGQRVAAGLALAVLIGPPMLPAQGAERVDASTLTGKLIMGYQGWFACPRDGRGWVHWATEKGATVDMLPDVADIAPADRCPTELTAVDGHRIEVFSSQSAATVSTHFDWMKQYGLDGVALQRFATEIAQPETAKPADTVLANVRRAAEHDGRVFFVMYDLSGLPPEKLPAVAADWKRLQAQGLTKSPAYLHHKGHPLVGLWGIGFADRPLTPAATEGFLAAMREASGVGGLTILGGVPGSWRTGDRDASNDPGWRAVWPKLDVVSPWTVGRYADDAGADAYRARSLAPDLDATRAMGNDLMPVVFPGFSWGNLMRVRDSASKAVTNQIPRRCGRFYWRQVTNAVGAGASMIYGAMFDEVDEGTAMFKLVPGSGQATPNKAFVTLDADGCRLPSDWYLRLAGAAGRALRHDIPLSPDLPMAILEQ